MLNQHPWYSLTENQILEELGERIRAIRLNQNLTQKQVSELVGKGPDEISRIESGKPMTMKSFLRILRALNQLENIEKAIQAPRVSPMKLFEAEEKKRKRASKSRKE